MVHGRAGMLGVTVMSQVGMVLVHVCACATVLPQPMVDSYALETTLINVIVLWMLAQVRHVSRSGNKY